ncbi:MAG: glutathione S-transferase family protein [Hyphomicrobium sp.]
MKLVVANKLYSSWSMRPWLVARAFGVAFDEATIPLRQETTKTAIGDVSPSGKLPVLIDGTTRVWESLAIIEYLAEAYPERAIWPTDRAARAHARAISNEMHGGFLPLRQACPMNLAKVFATPALSDDAKANVARIDALWCATRQRFGAGGPFLFGAFTAADAMYAPVAVRLAGYQIAVSPEAQRYMDALYAHPAFVAWRAAAFQEPWRIADYEVGHTAVHTYI